MRTGHFLFGVGEGVVYAEPLRYAPTCDAATGLGYPHHGSRSDLLHASGEFAHKIIVVIKVIFVVSYPSTLP